MLTSFASNIKTILEVVLNNIPYLSPRICDIGGAFGKYALLIREAIASNRSDNGDLCPNISDIYIANYDIAEYFQTLPWLNSIYNEIQWGDVKQCTNLLQSFDIVLMIDVVEHWTVDDFYKFVSEVNKPILISTPKNTVMYKERHYGFDQHQTQFTPDIFYSTGRIVEDYSTEDSYIILLK